MIHKMKPLKICFTRFILCHPFNPFSSAMAHIPVAGPRLLLRLEESRSKFGCVFLQWFNVMKREWWLDGTILSWGLKGTQLAREHHLGFVGILCVLAQMMASRFRLYSFHLWSPWLPWFHKLVLSFFKSQSLWRISIHTESKLFEVLLIRGPVIPEIVLSFSL